MNGSLSSLDIPSVLVNERGMSPTMSNASAPPNYDELDPPPSYATLFPIVKSDAELAAFTSLPQEDPAVSFHSVHHDQSHYHHRHHFVEPSSSSTDPDAVSDSFHSSNEI